MEEGTKALHKKVTEEIIINPLAMVRCSCYANFVRNYITKHGQWPPVIIDECCPNALRTAHAQNVDPNNLQIIRDCGQYNIDDFIIITLQPMKTFNYLENYIPYLKDKTISLIWIKL